MERERELEKYRKQLEAERERVLAQQHAMGAHASEEGYELADYDNHPADSATDTFEREKNIAIDRNYKDIIDRIDQALDKIDEGTYGLCDRCGQPINPRRLQAIPYATLCIDCQEVLERQ